MGKKPRVVISSNPATLLQHATAVKNGMMQVVDEATPPFDDGTIDGLFNDFDAALSAANVAEQNYQASRAKFKVDSLQRTAEMSRVRESMRFLRDWFFGRHPSNPETIGDYGFTIYVGPNTGGGSGNDGGGEDEPADPPA